MKFSKALPALAGAVVLLSACSDDASAPFAPDSALLSTGGYTHGFTVSEVPTDYVVVMEGHRIPIGFAGRVAELGGEIVASYGQIGIAVVRGLSAEAASELQAADEVQLVELDEQIQIIDPIGTETVTQATVSAHQGPAGASFFPRQWHMRAIGADRAWEAGRLGSSSVTVAILDTGLDYTYPDLAGRVDLDRSRDFVTWAGENQLRDFFFPGMHEVIDMHGHGTHVGNTVVSNGHIVAGVTQNVTLIGVKVLSAAGSGSSAGILAGIMYAADAGADVINMSLGGTFSKSANPGFVATINRAITYANRQGVVTVVSAGNSRIDMDHSEDLYKTYCSSPTTVCVSATGPTSGGTGPEWANVDAPAWYTNFGRSSVDVAAPGGNTGGSVWAACSKQRLGRTATGAWTWHTCSINTHLNYIVGMSGTSMASPHVAGLAALLVEDHGNNVGLIRQILHESADKLGESGNDPYYGKGRINVARALGLEEEAGPARSRPERASGSPAALRN